MSASAGEVARPTLRVRGLLGRAEPILITGGRAATALMLRIWKPAVVGRRRAGRSADAKPDYYAAGQALDMVACLK